MKGKDTPSSRALPVCLPSTKKNFKMCIFLKKLFHVATLSGDVV
jgi:hypothetical protein